MTVKSTGHEEAFQINYLANMLLALLLLPTLKAKGIQSGQTPHLTIVNTALTLAAKFPNEDADSLFPSFDGPKQWEYREQCHSSKLMAHMFLWKLVDYAKAGDVIVKLADPAWVKGTDLGRDAQGMMKVAMKAFGALGRTPKVGTSCCVDAVVTTGRSRMNVF